MDAAGKHRLPVHISPTAKIHHVLTVRGAAQAAQSEWGGQGSLFVTNQPLDDCATMPFFLGCSGFSGTYFHVFDEIVLDAVLLTLDTASDFITYLEKRERFLQNNLSVLAASEEDLLGLYLMGYDPQSDELDFPQNNANTIFVDGSHWQGWLTSRQRESRDATNRISYSWDILIEKFSHHLLKGTQDCTSSHEVAVQEPLLRWLSREPRVRRRGLVDNLIDMVNSTPPGRIRRRYHPPMRSGDPYWLFIVLPHLHKISYERYREMRRQTFLAHIYVVKYLNPTAEDIVGIAVGASHGEMTEDAMCVDFREWLPKDMEVGRILHEQDGIFAAPITLNQTYWDYPISEHDD
ncbi:hypothetical protein QGP82_04255 [Leptothoe sp. LEGE 181152]|nr:hypothetical protein [Leptothoe sp. LEGE 181152]